MFNTSFYVTFATTFLIVVAIGIFCAKACSVENIVKSHFDPFLGYLVSSDPNDPISRSRILVDRIITIFFGVVICSLISWMGLGIYCNINKISFKQFFLQIYSLFAQ